VINFDLIETNLSVLREKFAQAEPFSLVVIDHFADSEKLAKVVASFPLPEKDNINKSRDYIFAKNKYEKSDFKQLSGECQELYDDLISDRFKRLLQEITQENVFVDPEFHGGGIHQGGKDSFLDMHVDFNYHPLHKNWFRNLNVLLYLNQNWQSEYGGQLKLRNTLNNKTLEIEPIFNRCVIMFTRDYTLHGYDRINFPVEQFRRSLAIYAYSLEENPGQERSTLWIPENSSTIKKLIGRYWPTIVKLKNSIFGSGTAKNK
jgi:hypothetical protein